MTLDLRAFIKGCAKGLLMGLNGLCILIGLCLIGFAAVDARIVQQYGETEARGTLVGDVIIIVACLLLIVVASFGGVGAARENVKFLYLYVGFLMVLVALELLLLIYVSLQRYGLEFRVASWMREDFFKNVTGQELADHKQLWDELQTNYECCGLNGPEDYEIMGQRIVLSCCPRSFHTRNDYAQTQLHDACIIRHSFYKSGCEEEILFALREGSDCLLGIAILCFAFETASILLSIWIANNLKNEVKIYKQTLRY